MLIKKIIFYFNKFFILKSLISFLRKFKHKVHILNRAFYYRRSIIIDEDLHQRDFIILKRSTNKWRVVGFENVGMDLHIQIERLNDNKIFLMDQSFFYSLQLGMVGNAPKELEFVYAIKQDGYKIILKTLKALGLC